jgi:AraC family transcriptional regulator
MSVANNKTAELWSSFMPKRNEILHTLDSNFYSVELYDSLDFFKAFNPSTEFEKWAAIQVSRLEETPNGLETLEIPGGKYAVFHYIGRPSEAQTTYQYIYGSWLPNSDYELDRRPHFALMGEKYKGEDSNSEEELWIPIQHKQ